MEPSRIAGRCKQALGQPAHACQRQPVDRVVRRDKDEHGELVHALCKTAASAVPICREGVNRVVRFSPMESFSLSVRA